MIIKWSYFFLFPAFIMFFSHPAISAKFYITNFKKCIVNFSEAVGRTSSWGTKKNKNTPDLVEPNNKKNHGVFTKNLLFM